MVSMLLMGVGALAIPSRALRVLLFGVLGFCLVVRTVSRQREEFHAINQLDASSALTVTGRVLSTPAYSRGEYRFAFRTDSLADANGRAVLRGKVIYCMTPDSVPFGAPLRLKGSFNPPSPAPVPGGFDRYTHLLSSGIWGDFQADTFELLPQTRSILVRTFAGVRQRVHDVLAHLDSDDHRAILEAAFLGERQGLSEEMTSLFKSAGIIHLLALSGFHVGVLTAFVLLLLHPLPLGRTPKLLLCVAVLWCYLFMVGFLPSLTRAVVMTTVVLLSFLVQRRAISLSALGSAGCLWLCLSPQSLFTPAYQLSFSATLGLLTIYPLFSEAFSTKNKILRVPLSALLISLTAFLSTAPILAFHFGTLSMYGLFANVAAVSIMGAAIWSFFVAMFLQMVLPVLAYGVMHLSGFFLSILISLARPAQTLPLTALALPVPPTTLLALFVLCLLLPCLVQKTWRKSCAAWMGALFFLFAPLILLHSRRTTTNLTFIASRTEGVLVLQWPYKQIWAVASGKSISSTLYRTSIAPLLRSELGGTGNTLICLRPTIGFSGQEFNRVLSPVTSPLEGGYLFPPLEAGGTIELPGKCTCHVIAAERQGAPYDLSCSIGPLKFMMVDGTDSLFKADSAIAFVRPRGTQTIRRDRMVIIDTLLISSRLLPSFGYALQGNSLRFTPRLVGSLLMRIEGDKIVELRTGIPRGHPVQGMRRDLFPHSPPREGRDISS